VLARGVLDTAHELLLRINGFGFECDLLGHGGLGVVSS
jgi:hypothetical protein